MRHGARTLVVLVRHGAQEYQLLEKHGSVGSVNESSYANWEGNDSSTGATRSTRVPTISKSTALSALLTNPQRGLLPEMPPEQQLQTPCWNNPAAHLAHQWQIITMETRNRLDLLARYRVIACGSLVSFPHAPLTSFRPSPANLLPTVLPLCEPSLSHISISARLLS